MLKRFGSVVAVRELTLEIADGEFVVLVGPSGSGKTTALRMLAGLEAVSSRPRPHRRPGRADASPPRERDIAMVFQDYALYPQMTVFDNLAFGLQSRKVPRGEIEAAGDRGGAAAGAGRAARAQAPASSPAGSASASRWAGRWCASRRCS